MSDVILVVLERRPAAPGLLRAAARLAELVGSARINALAAATLPQDEITALRDAFEAWAAGIRRPDIAVQWLGAEGTLEASIEARGRRADLIVVAQPGQDSGRTSWQAFRAALFHTERPLLMYLCAVRRYSAVASQSPGVMTSVR